MLHIPSTKSLSTCSSPFSGLVAYSFVAPIPSFGDFVSFYTKRMVPKRIAKKIFDESSVAGGGSLGSHSRYLEMTVVGSIISTLLKEAPFASALFGGFPVRTRSFHCARCERRISTAIWLIAGMFPLSYSGNFLTSCDMIPRTGDLNPCT